MGCRRRLARLLRRLADWLYVEPTNRLTYEVHGFDGDISTMGEHPPLGWDVRYSR